MEGLEIAYISLVPKGSSMCQFLATNAQQLATVSNLQTRRNLTCMASVQYRASGETEASY